MNETQQKNSIHHHRLYKAEEIAYIFHISKSTVYKLVREKKIPYRKIGKSVRFQYDEVLDAIESHHVELKDYATRKEVANALGVHYQTITSWTRQGVFAEYCHEIGGITRYNLTAILLAFEEGKFSVSNRMKEKIQERRK